MAIEDVFYDMFFDTFDKDGSRRRCRSMTRDGIREGRSEFYYGEDVVKLSKGWREFEFVRSFSDSSFNCVRTQAAMGEFSGGACSFDITSVQPNSISGFKVGSWGSSAVVVMGVLILCLGQGRLCLS